MTDTKPRHYTIVTPHDSKLKFSHHHGDSIHLAITLAKLHQTTLNITRACIAHQHNEPYRCPKFAVFFTEGQHNPQPNIRK